jgi:Muramidase (flagellum-specific)
MDEKLFIDKIKDAAVSEMNKHNVLASLTIAQAILESGWGESYLTKNANNLFGIKRNGYADYIEIDTVEYINGNRTTIVAEFRKYASWNDSISDHTLFLLSNSRYSNIIGNRDYKTVCQLIQQDGYATDPSYSSKLINIIEHYSLNNYDAVNNSNNIPVDNVDPNILWLQRALNQLKVTDFRGSSLEEDGIKGALTTSAVTKFQSITALVADGIAGPITTAALKLILGKPLLTFGSKGIAVRYIQFRLKIACDGDFGKITHNSVVAYQKINLLTIDGIVGPNTWQSFIG